MRLVVQGESFLDTTELLNKAQAHSLALTITSIGEQGSVGFSNHGYWGIHVIQGSTYNLSFYAKGGALFKGALKIRLETADGKQVLAEERIDERDGRLAAVSQPI